MRLKKEFTGLEMPSCKQKFGTTAMHKSKLWSHHAAENSLRHGCKCPWAHMPVYVITGSRIAAKRECWYTGCVLILQKKKVLWHKMKKQWFCDEWTKHTPCALTLKCIDEAQIPRLLSEWRVRSNLSSWILQRTIIHFRTKGWSHTQCCLLQNKVALINTGD